MILKTDCRHFPGDRPCRFHKATGVHCDTCGDYSRASHRILIIKFDALGDVLRTTAILPSIKKKYPDSHITWLTRPNAQDLFINNPLVDAVWSSDDASVPVRLGTLRFDVLIHPDASKASAAFAALARATDRYGYGLDERDSIVCFSDEAHEWLEMGAFDDCKKRNLKTYQQVIHEIAGLPYDRSDIMVNLTPSEMQWAEEFRNRHHLGRYRHLIGLNTGAGGRWQFKKWRLDGYRELIRRLDPSCGVLLYGGPEEVERNAVLVRESSHVIDTGTDNSIRRFFSLVSLCDVMVTGDTMALHVATALCKRVVCLFGPTSANEIESYDRIVKVQPDMDCLVCYKMECDFVPNCMDTISVEDVLAAVRSCLT